MFLLLTLFPIFQNIQYIQGDTSCRFADLFTIDNLVKNENNAIHRFKMHMCLWEGKFGNGVGYNHQTGITYDGHKIDYTVRSKGGEKQDFILHLLPLYSHRSSKNFEVDEVLLFSPLVRSLGHVYLILNLHTLFNDITTIYIGRESAGKIQHNLVKRRKFQRRRVYMYIYI